MMDYREDPDPLCRDCVVKDRELERLRRVERAAREAHKYLTHVLGETPLGTRVRRYEVSVAEHVLAEALRTALEDA